MQVVSPTKRQRRLQRERDRARNAITAVLRTRGSGRLISRLDPMATAIHEAAHCVFYEAFGITVDWTTCDPQRCPGIAGDEQLGYVCSNADKIVLPAVLHILRTLAGDLAERPFITNKPFGIDSAFMSHTDWNTLHSDFRSISLPESAYSESYLYYARLCLELIELSEQWIEAVAVEMYANKTIQGDAIRKILRARDFYEPGNHLVAFASRAKQATEVMGKSSLITRPAQRVAA